jgi:hypothetical protein
MAPKRKSIQSDNVSQKATKRRFSKRLDGIITNDETTTNVMPSSKKNQLKKKINMTKSITNKENQANTKIMIENSKMLFLILFYK